MDEQNLVLVLLSSNAERARRLASNLSKGRGWQRSWGLATYASSRRIIRSLVAQLFRQPDHAPPTDLARSFDRVVGCPRHGAWHCGSGCGGYQAAARPVYSADFGWATGYAAALAGAGRRPQSVRCDQPIGLTQLRAASAIVLPLPFLPNPKRENARSPQPAISGNGLSGPAPGTAQPCLPDHSPQCLAGPAGE